MKDWKHYETCFFCGSKFQMGRGVYDGKWINEYQVSTCKTCYEANHDGWMPDYGAKLLEHLRSKGIKEPALNPMGLIPRRP